MSAHYDSRALRAWALYAATVLGLAAGLAAVGTLVVISIG